jgi:hypothetical protein
MFYRALRNGKPDGYIEKLKSIKTSEDIVRQYVYNLANLVNRNIVIKSQLLRLPTYILFIGVGIGSILLLFI